MVNSHTRYFDILNYYVGQLMRLQQFRHYRSQRLNIFVVQNHMDSFLLLYRQYHLQPKENKCKFSYSHQLNLNHNRFLYNLLCLFCGQYCKQKSICSKFHILQQKLYRDLLIFQDQHQKEFEQLTHKSIFYHLHSNVDCNSFLIYKDYVQGKIYGFNRQHQSY